MIASQANEIRSLIAQARRQLAYLARARARYTNPDRWVGLRADRLARTAAAADDRIREHASLAVRWAVADARRHDHPDVAARADDELHRVTGLTVADLEHERDEAYQQGLRDAEVRQDPATAGDLVVPGLSAATIGAMVYTVSADGIGVDSEASDGLTAPETVSGAEGAVFTAPPDPEASIVDATPADAVAPAELPDGLFPYSIDESLAHVAAAAGHGPAEAAQGMAATTGPVADAVMGL